MVNAHQDSLDQARLWRRTVTPPLALKIHHRHRVSPNDKVNK